MSVYVDVSAAVHAKAGLSRYATNLVHALVPLLGDQLALFQNSLGKCGPLDGLADVPVSGTSLGYRPWRAAVLAAQALHLSSARLAPGARVFHATEHLLPPVKAPTVMTVHDLIFELYPHYHRLPNYVYLKAAMPLYCRRAGRIIAVSQATRHDLLERYGLAEDKIVVVPEAAAPHFAPATPEEIERVRIKFNLHGRYIVAVGTLEPRKNIANLALACGPLFQRGLAEMLVVVGARGWLFEDAMRQISSLPWSNRVLMPGYVTDQDLVALYSGAMLTVQPSYYEGFGLPVLEAMACGSPVCASNTSSLPEVGGDAAEYFDPQRIESMVGTLERVADDDELRAQMRCRGLERAKAYSWEATARQTVAVYQQLAPEIVLYA
ncbi:MAG: glycosyltransferase family 1 protein [Anaerolineales bacterium]